MAAVQCSQWHKHTMITINIRLNFTACDTAATSQSCSGHDC